VDGEVEERNKELVKSLIIAHLMEEDESTAYLRVGIKADDLVKEVFDLQKDHSQPSQ
jgi:hypothetical protein